MTVELSRAVAAITGAAVVQMDRLQGGSLSVVFRVALDKGGTVVAKQAEGAGREAEMLTRIAQTGAAVPRVLGHQPNLVVMEDLGPTGSLAGDEGKWNALWEMLQRLHGASGDAYGWVENHAFGPVEIVNTRTNSWPEFWAQHRLIGPATGLDPSLRARIAHLASRLPDLLPAAPAPALLHGDLWAGNVLIGGDGRPVMIDPACYFGDPRVDLAMLELFGAPPSSFRRRTAMSDPGWPKIRAIYQLWPALVHLRLFGEQYLSYVTDRLDALNS